MNAFAVRVGQKEAEKRWTCKWSLSISEMRMIGTISRQKQPESNRQTRQTTPSWDMRQSWNTSTSATDRCDWRIQKITDRVRWFGVFLFSSACPLSRGCGWFLETWQTTCLVLCTAKRGISGVYPWLGWYLWQVYTSYICCNCLYYYYQWRYDYLGVGIARRVFVYVCMYVCMYACS